MDLGRTGIWTFQLDGRPMAAKAQVAAEAGDGYGAIWVPEAVSREALVNSALLLAGTRRIAVATGIANLWGRDAMTMAAGQKTIAEAFPDQDLLGIGVSQRAVRRRGAGPPLRQAAGRDGRLSRRHGQGSVLRRRPSRAAGAGAGHVGAEDVGLVSQPGQRRPPVLRAAGAHRLRRGSIGNEGPILAPEQAVVLDTNPETDAADGPRATWRPTSGCRTTDNNLRRLGLGGDDIANGGSDKLVDAIVAWGDVDTIAARVAGPSGRRRRPRLCAGDRRRSRAVPLEQWRTLAPASPDPHRPGRDVHNRPAGVGVVNTHGRRTLTA